MSVVQCLICGAEFYVKPSHQAKGWGKYCSIKCRTSSQFKGSTFKCFICKKEIYRSPLAIKKSKSGKYFCSKICQTVWRNTILFSGRNHSNWTYGESAYRRILKSSDKTQICVLCSTKDKRVLIVHHVNKNRRDNDIANLIWLCCNCHYLVHHFTEINSKLLRLIV
mgnify:FL=1